MNYAFPCVFVKDISDKKHDSYYAYFPDWEEKSVAVTSGISWPEAKYMAKDLLSILCVMAEDDGESFPEAGQYNREVVDAFFKDLPFAVTDYIIRTVHVDTDAYRKACALYKKVGRYRMRHKAEHRYWFANAVQDPAYDVEDI